MDLIPWIILGLLAGWISGWFVGLRSVQGCLPTTVVGIAGSLVGLWVNGVLGLGGPAGFVSLLVVATLGSVLVRVVLRAIESGGGR